MAQNSGSFMGFVHRRRRGAELFLLVLALAVGIGAYAAVGLGVEGEVPADIIGYGGWLAALVIGAHIVVRLVAPYADPVLLPVVAALNGLGLAVIHRLDLAYEALDEPHDFAQQQLIWMTLGVAALRGAPWSLLRDHRRAAALHLHQRAGRDRAAAAADAPGHRQRPSTAPGSGSTSARSASSPARSPRCCW